MPNSEEGRAVTFPGATVCAVIIGGTLLAATIAAYLGRIPVEIRAIPFYDSIGHFMLFGGLAAALDRASRGRTYRGMPIAVAFVGCYALVDESLQSLSPMRTFSVSDLAAGLIGVAVLVRLVRVFTHRR